MLKLDLQLFASKKVWVPQRTVVIPSPNVLALSVQTVRQFLAEASSFVNVVLKSTQERT